MLRVIKNHDIIITIIAIFLSVLSVLLIYSTTFNAQTSVEGEGAWQKQVVFLVIGFAVYFFISNIHINIINQKTIVVLILVLTFISLIYLLLFADTIASTQRWIQLGPLSFQPAEFAKISIVIASAYLYAKATKTDSTRTMLISSLIVATLGFLIFLQPSFGNALILFFIWGILFLIFAAIKLNLIALLGILLLIIASYHNFQGIFNSAGDEGTIIIKLLLILFAIIITVVFLKIFEYRNKIIPLFLIFILLLGPGTEFFYNNILRDYHRGRVQTFLAGNESDPTGSGFQVRQSLIAIGSGQLTGRGYMQGTQSSLKVLPFAHTDFIFAAFSEQFGFIGIIILFSIYMLLIYRLWLAYNITSDIFSKFMVIGVTAIIVTNLFINTSMNLGLIPVTGVPLPLISYGGSSVVLIMMCLGIAQMVRNSVTSKDLTTKFIWENKISYYNNTQSVD